MSTFTDLFNRADGGLSNNWVDVTPGFTISSNKVVCPANAQAYQSSINASGRQESLITFNVTADSGLYAGVTLKFKASPIEAYLFYGTGTRAAPIWHIAGYYSGTFQFDITTNGGSLSDGDHTLRALYADGVLTLWIDGGLVRTYANSALGSNSGAGIYAYSGGAVIDDITFLGNESVTLQVSPSPIGNFNNSTVVTFTGVATAWTSGTPGAPTFTVDHGTLSNQEVISGTSATATYTPGSFLGLATFADPSTGATALVTVTSDTTVVFPPSGAGGLAQEVIAWLEAQAEAGGHVLRAEDSIKSGGVTLEIGSPLFDIKASAQGTSGPVPNAAAPDGLAPLLWLILNGGFPAATPPESAPYDLPLAHGIDRVHDQLDAISGNGVDTLDSVLQLLGGDPFASNNTIYEAIQAIPGVDLAPVTDAIAALRGDESATVAQAVASLAALRTGSAWTLADVKQWIEAVPTAQTGVTAAAVVALIAALLLAAPSGGASVAAAAVAVGAGPVLDIATIVELIAVATDIAALIQTANDIKNSIGTAATVGPPVWIDEAHADVGDPVALVDALEITGPLDGLLITITDQPSGASKFGFGDMHSWRYVGAVIFQTDRGDWEWSQPIGLEAQVITPKTMAHAAAARFRLESGWEGTARAFTVTAGT